MNTGKKTFFIENKIMGKLKIIRVFVFYDYPRSFVCENQINMKYLFSEIDDGDNYAKWVVLPISSFKYTQLLRNKLFLREALINSETNIFFEVSLDFATNNTELIVLDKCPEDKIMQSDFYVGNTDIVSEDLHNILSVSRLEGSPQLDIITNEYEDSLPGIDAISFSNINEKSRLYLSSLYGRPINPLVYTLSGSFVIRISINEPTNIFDGNDSIECINTFNEILKTQDADVRYDLMKKNRKTAQRYLDFLDTLSRLNKDIKIVTATPENEAPEIIPLKNAIIIEAKKQMENILSKKVISYDVSGILVEFNSRTPSFQILTNEKAIKGKYDQTILNPDFIYGVNSRVSGTIEETIYLNKDGSEAKKKHNYLLTSLSFIN